MIFFDDFNDENGTAHRMRAAHARGHHLRRMIDKVTGLPYHVLLFLWLCLSFAFGITYFLLGNIPGHGPVEIEGMNTMRRLGNSMYYSVITATSTGYGDITPQGVSKFLAATQSILALFIFAVFVTKLVSRRQDIALRQIHKLSFEDAFHNIREGFFIVRHDCNRIIAKASVQHALDERDWEDLTTAYWQAQSFLRRIPDFYDEHNRIYSLDVRREELLQEGLHRTLQRIDHLIEILGSKHIRWTEHNHSLEELREFVQLVVRIVHFWLRQSPYLRTESFENLLNLNEGIHRKIEEATRRKK
jgi:hypothetical protein